MFSCANHVASEVMKRVSPIVGKIGGERSSGNLAGARFGPPDADTFGMVVPALGAAAAGTGPLVSSRQRARRLIGRIVGLAALSALGAIFFSVADSEAQGRVVVDERVCRSIVVHQPDPGVEFQPGEDVYGRPVAPADLPNSPTVDLGDSLDIPVIVDLAERYPELFDATGLDLQVSLGTLTLNGNEVRLNDTPLGDPLTDAIAALCEEQDVP